MVAGLGLMAVALGVQAADWRQWGEVSVACYLLAAMLFVGELRAIPVPRGDDTTDELTVSSTFATALVLIGPVGLALAVQALARAHATHADLLDRRGDQRGLQDGCSIARRLGEAQQLPQLGRRRPVLTEVLIRGDPHRALMVGDSQTDIDTAKAAGIPVVAVDFGYTDRHVREFEPSAVISHFDALTLDLAQRLIAAAAGR